jgi:hypothetical protein
MAAGLPRVTGIDKTWQRTCGAPVRNFFGFVTHSRDRGGGKWRGGRGDYIGAAAGGY